MIVVDCLDHGLDLRAFLLACSRHAACYLGGIAFNACNQSVWKGVSLRAGVERLDDDNFLARVSAPSDDGHPTNFEDYTADTSARITVLISTRLLSHFIAAVMVRRWPSSILYRLVEFQCGLFSQP